MSKFYANLPPVPSLDALCDPGAFSPLPDDWYLAVADVAGSTRAIAAGRYKAVNTAETTRPTLQGAIVVLAGNANQRRQLTEQLDARRRSGELTFGIHVSDSAIMTCLVRQRQYEHVHFVDASGGGYAAAAKQMKAQ